MVYSKKHRWPACLVLCWSLAVFDPAGAQQGRIQGQVVETGTRAPLAGASVSVIGASIGALSDADGHLSSPAWEPALTRCR